MACATLDVSWYPTEGTHAAIYRKRDGPISGQYSDFYDYRFVDSFAKTFIIVKLFAPGGGALWNGVCLSVPPSLAISPI